MSETKEFTYAEVANHSSKKDLYIVVHDKVYDASSFVDEHPGGEEVLLDVGGQDSTEAFEDVGHSDEAREILEAMMVGNLKRMPGDPAPHAPPPSKSTSTNSGTESGGLGVMMYAILIIGGAVAFGAYSFLNSKDKSVKL